MHVHCFDAGSMVTLADGTQKLVSQLFVGEKVLSWKKGQVSHSKVYYVRSHFDFVKMISIEAESNEERFSIKLTEDHLLYVVKNQKEKRRKERNQQIKKKTVPSYLVNENDEILVLDPAIGILKKVKVISVKKFQQKQEVFSVLSTKHNLIVNGILASCYQTNHTWEKIDSFPMRVLFEISPSIMKSEKYQRIADRYDDFVELSATRLFRFFRTGIPSIS